MRTKSFGHGKHACHSYLKKVGNGWETGFVFNHKTVFVGNFIHQKEAGHWFGCMNREIQKFSRKYAVGTTFPVAWFAHFIGHHLYKTYYTFLDSLFTQHTRAFSKAVVQDLRKYRAMRKQWSSREVRPFYSKKAA